MRKVFAILLAGVLTLGLTVTAFAAPSPSGGETSAIISSVSGDVTIDELEWTSEFSFTENDVLSAARALGIDTNAVKIGATGDLHLKSSLPFTGSATIVFNVADVVAIIHYTGSSWEKVGDGATATFANGFSPVVVLVKSTSQDGGQQSGGGQQQSSGGGKSPVTGEAPFIAGMVLLAVLAGAGVIFSRVRKTER